jgi:tRNA threonylcarbamoyladenosine biosynthesis protein TsaB
MTILCIETSTSVCSAAICKDGEPIKQCVHYEGSNHARLLPLYIEDLLQYVRENGLTIDAVALSEGPGSYTGLRIGTSTAKGICYGLNIPLIPVPTLDILCEAAREKVSCIHAQLQTADPAVLVPMIDARRMEVYTKELRDKGQSTKENNARAVVVENEESLSCINAQCYYFGDGAEKCSRVFTKPNWHYIAGIVPEARYMGALVENKKIISGADLAYYEPFYLKEFIAAPSHVKGLKS